MTLLAIDNFWRDVVRSPTDCALAFPIELDLRSKTEVTDLDLHLVCQEEVAELEVSVHDAVLVHILDSHEKLNAVALDFDLCEVLPALYQIVQRLITTELYQDVNVFFILEVTFELCHILMLHRPVYFYFTN